MYSTFTYSVSAKFYKMRLPKRSWQEVLLYASGMLTIILGIASSIISIDPTPIFPSSSWWYFLVAGLGLIVVGCLLLKTVICAPVYPKSFFTVGQSADMTASSAVDLLDDTQSVGYGDSPVVELKDAKFGFEEPSEVVRQCMMTSSDEPHNSVYFYYKETFV